MTEQDGLHLHGKDRFHYVSSVGEGGDMSNNSGLCGTVKKQWMAEGLCDSSGAVIPTFIEEIGAASAENVRSAALKRWMNAHPEYNTRWLTGLIPELASRAPFTAGRELTLDSGNRIDLVLHDKDGKPAVFIENKWLSHMGQSQIASYREIIDRDYPGTHLFAIGPIAHTRPQHDPEIKFVATTWQGLADFVSASTRRSGSGAAATIEEDLSKTLQRIKMMSDAISDAVDRGAKLSEFFELFGRLSAEKKQDCGTAHAYGELVRRLVVTGLADKLKHRLNSGNGISQSPWRRSLATAGANGSFDADICPEYKNDGLIGIPGAPDNTVALNIRFSSSEKFENIGVAVGTALLPYLEGKKRKDWVSTNPRRIEIAGRHLHDVRSELTSLLGVPEPKRPKNPDTVQWFKGIGRKKFGPDSNVSELIEYATGLVDPIYNTLKKFD